jgi:hypothetical protein
MAEERAPAARPPRRAAVAQRLLSRARRFQRSGGARLTASVVARHRAATQAIVPRLLPQRETLPRVPMSVGSPAERPDLDAAPSAPSAARSEPHVSASAPEGMSEFAAEWLFGDGAVEGIPFAGGAAVPAERRSERPAFLTAPSAPPPAVATRAPGRGARPRGRVQEGPVRLSGLPPTQGDAPAAPPHDPESAGAPAPVSVPLPPTDPAPATAPAPATRRAPDSTPSPHSPVDPAPSAFPAPASPAVPDSSATAPAGPPPASHAPRVVVATKRSSEPAGAPPPRAPVVLRRVARVPAPVATVAAISTDPRRGLLRRAIDRVLPARREQAGAPASPPLARAPSAQSMPAPSSRPVSARAARPAAGQADVLARSTTRNPSPAQASAAFEPPDAARLREAREHPAPGAPPARSPSPGGVPADDAPLENPAAAQALSEPQLPKVSTSESSSIEATPAPSGPALDTSGEARSSAPVDRTPGSPPARRPVDSGDSNRRGPAAAPARGSGPSIPVVGREAPASGAPAPSGLRRVAARLRATRTPQAPPSWEDRTAPLAAAARPLEHSSTGAQSVAPMTIYGSSADPRLSDSRSPSSPNVTGAEIHASKTDTPAPSAPMPGMTQPTFPPSSRPSVRLRRVAARIASPQLTRASSPRRDSHPQPSVRTSGERLAGATGAALHRELANGLETIEFPIASAAGSGTADAGLGSALARAAAGAGGPPSPGAAVGQAPAAGAAAQPAEAPEGEGGVASHGGASASHAGASPEADDLYEHVIERLRRDLLSERERMGDLLGDLP